MSKAPQGNPMSRVSTTVQVALWVAVLIIAFFMQVVPFLLVLTMLNLAVGITSTTALIVVPVAAFAMLSLACWVATRRTRNILPEPLPRTGYVSSYAPGASSGEQPTAQQRVIAFLQQWRHRRY